ncbi:hypothetical protein GF325_03165 [Candidatus Bathyarchaeota archaeon]|nr:hypothetical protein [Candidatus Bathyarchaeota archaeon]
MIRIPSRTFILSFTWDNLAIMKMPRELELDFKGTTCSHAHYILSFFKLARDD